MRVKPYLRWELLLALSLVGCTSVVPNRTGLPQQPATAVQDVKPVTGLNLGTRLLFQVRWPQSDYAAQAIPGLTQTIEVKVVKGGQDPALAASEVKKVSLQRPAPGTGDTTTATFNLDPALKVVDVYVRALAADGVTELSFGKRLAVPVRDNTTTGITVTLSTTGNLPELDQARIVNHLEILKLLPEYFKAYDQLIHYPDSLGAKDFTASMEAIFKEWMPKPVYSEEKVVAPTPESSPPIQTATAYRTSSRYTVMSMTDRLLNPENPAVMMDVLNGEVQKLYWPGYEAVLTYTDEGAKHSFQVAVTPPLGGGGDGTRANLKAELSAGSWVSEPSLSQNLDAWQDTGTATMSVNYPLTFFGGKKPADGTITGGKVNFDIVPKGNTANAFAWGASADTFRDISNTPLYLAMTQKDQGARQVTVAPKHVQLTTQTPPLAATSDITINDDLLGFKSRSDLRVKNNADGYGAFLLDLGGSMRLGPIGDHQEPVGGSLGLVLTDQGRKLRLEGSVQVERIPFKATFIGRFIDVPTNTVVGTINYVVPVDANGKVDMNHLSSWPILKLEDDKHTEINLTPGFFSGETNGFVRVDVR